MAEKEERIVFFWLPTDGKLENAGCIIADSETTYRCHYNYECEKCKEGMTRQEAIKKMCEGWNKLREQINADKEHAHCCSNKMIMEAALNALLGVEKL